MLLSGALRNNRGSHYARVREKEGTHLTILTVLTGSVQVCVVLLKFLRLRLRDEVPWRGQLEKYGGGARGGGENFLQRGEGEGKEWGKVEDGNRLMLTNPA